MAAFVFFGVDGLEATATEVPAKCLVPDSHLKGGSEISISMPFFNPKLRKDGRKMSCWIMRRWFYYVNWLPLHNATANPRMVSELRPGRKSCGGFSCNNLPKYMLLQQNQRLSSDVDSGVELISARKLRGSNGLTSSAIESPSEDIELDHLLAAHGFLDGSIMICLAMSNAELYKLVGQGASPIR